MVSPNILTVSKEDGALAGWEIASVVSSGLIAEWAISGLGGKETWLGAIPIVLALVLVWFSQRERGETFYDLGFRLDNFLSACRLLVLPTAVAIALIALGSWWLGSELSWRPLRVRLLVVPLWALFQQYVLQGFINRRAQIRWGRGLKSIFLVAFIFGLLHLPSPLLGVLAVIGGFLWAGVYQKQPNLLALAISHSLVSLSLSIMIPARLSSNLRIGFKYFGMQLGLHF